MQYFLPFCRPLIDKGQRIYLTAHRCHKKVFQRSKILSNYLICILPWSAVKYRRLSKQINFWKLHNFCSVPYGVRGGSASVNYGVLKLHKSRGGDQTLQRVDPTRLSNIFYIFHIVCIFYIFISFISFIMSIFLFGVSPKVSFVPFFPIQSSKEPSIATVSLVSPESQR